MNTQTHTPRCHRAFAITTTLVFATAIYAIASGTETIVLDPVDDSWEWTPGGNWTNNAANPHMWSTAGTPYDGLSARTGTLFYVGFQNGSTGTNRGIAKYFGTGTTIEAGIYTATFDIGHFDSHPFPSSFTISFLANTDNETSAKYDWNERFTGASVKTGSVPEAGTWETWTYQFTITQDTTNAAGASVVGTELGFLILANVKNGAGFAFDNLAITREALPVPEPATLATLLASLTLAAVCHRRHRHRHQSARQTK
jgi:hypothetical protein